MKAYEYIAIFAGLLTGIAFIPQLLKAICLGGTESALSNLGLSIYTVGIILWIVWGSLLLQDTLNDDEEGYNGLVSVIFSSISLTAVLLTLTFNVQAIRTRLYGRYMDSINKFCQSKRARYFLDKL